ncbi:MAG: methyltransferase domain-containing protein [Firmicutes bacterium]|nr:methyltransferase domain-containing protein [Bacillota bacterium]
MTALSLTAIDAWGDSAWARIPPRYHWLLLQTIATREERRAWIQEWPLAPDALVIDVGTGLGIMAHEIAALHGCRVMGIDRDAAALAIAHDLNRHCSASQVTFQLADIYAPLPAWTADLAVARFVAQHVPDIHALFSRLGAWVRPGGLVAAEDVDDAYLVEYPSPPPTWQQAVQAFQRYQSGARGDRLVGRKLAQAGLEAGLTLEQVTLNPRVAVRTLTPQDPAVEFDISRIREALPAMVAQGLLTEDAWAQAERDYRAALPRLVYLSTATVRVLFRRPAG